MSRRSNGVAPPAARHRIVRTEKIRLAGDLEGTEVTLRLNPPLWVYDLFSTEVRKGLGMIVLDWTLVDDEGKPVPLDATLSGATDEELAAIARGYMEVLQARVTLPNSDATPSGIGTPTST